MLNSPLKMSIAFFAASIMLIAVAIMVDNHNQEQWDQFSVEHTCKQVGHKDSTVGYGMTTSGKMGTIIIPTENSFICDDGITYTR